MEYTESTLYVVVDFSIFKIRETGFSTKSQNLNPAF